MQTLYALTLVGALTAAAPPPTDDAAAIAAWQTMQQDPAQFRLPEALREHPLAPWLQAESLRRRLGTDRPPADEEVAALLARHAGDPAIWRLRREWLLSLAARRRWEQLLEALPQMPGDARLACEWLRARLATGRTEGLAGHVRERWLRPDDQPQACDEAFDWLARTGVLDEDLIAQRLGMAIEAGNRRIATYLLRRLPVARRGQWRWPYDLRFDPLRALERLARAPNAPVGAEAMADAFAQVARRDPESALRLYQRLAAREDVEPAALRRMHEALALGLAWARDLRALEWMERPMPDAPQDQLRPWQLRAALWAGDLAAAQRALARLPRAEREQARWQYWAGRIAQAQGATARAREHYRRAAAQREFHGFLAAERISAPPPLAHRPLVVDQERLSRLAASAGMVRARLLFALQERELARSQWNHATAALGAEDLAAAAVLATRWGWHDAAIRALARIEAWDDLELRFPLPYREAVAAAARDSGLPAHAIYAVMRSESLFDPDARSPARAHGLMQLRLPTARGQARQVGIAPPDRGTLHEPAVNIALGAGYLAELLARYGSWPLALAAYNAGPRAVARWRPDRAIDADIWIENIPYDETRGYIERVMMAMAIYHWRLEGRPLSLSELLGQVAP